MAGIRLKDIHKTYQVDGRTFPVLNGVDLEIPEGKITVILGQSGCGKTTLLRLTGGLESADSGEVLWDGAHKTAFVFQEPRLMPWLNVWNNIIFGLKKNQVDQEKIQDIVSTVNLSGFEKTYPSQLSGGMQQRLQIARNLVTQPKLVFMDEPTGGLDVSVQARLLDLLRGLAVELNLAVVIVTHDLGVARLLANRLLVMKQGQVVESGLTDRVLDDPHHPYTQLLVSSVLQN